jgi:hypothetical protein
MSVVKILPMNAITSLVKYCSLERTGPLLLKLCACLLQGGYRGRLDRFDARLASVGPTDDVTDPDGVADVEAAYLPFGGEAAVDAPPVEAIDDIQQREGHLGHA